ncbi:uncharacterized protein LOC143562087 [Bidens hawaiensis]|uniref:uncharacterized protein LOC143562087 n=1 Tax=Bidens hawaiensis TaxID=980011 RepID=UPI004049C1E8
MEHFKKNWPKLYQGAAAGQLQASTSGAPRGRAFVIGPGEARQDPNVVAELANGNSIFINRIVQNCPIILNDHQFLIDLLPVELGSFDVIVIMDWLAKFKAEIVCNDKVVKIPLSDGETIMIQREKSGSILSLVSHIKVLKCLRQGCMAFLANVTVKHPNEKHSEDIPVVCEYSDVFPDELPGLPPTR